MANKKLRKAIRSDVMDELMFISGDHAHYTMGQRQTARTLLHALDNTVWEPEVEIKKVIDILDGHHVEAPKYPVRERAKVN